MIICNARLTPKETVRTPATNAAHGYVMNAQWIFREDFFVEVA